MSISLKIMTVFPYVFPVRLIREEEQELIDAQSEPDQLMRQAADAVAAAATTMCKNKPPVLLKVQATEERILLLVGSGGNGGDALYAGAKLADRHQVDAVLLGRDGRAHERGLAAFRTAGGNVLEALPEDLRRYRLVIDGLVGLGGTGGIGEEVALFIEHLSEFDMPILAVDVPSGVNADTGSTAPPIFVQRHDRWVELAMTRPDSPFDPTQEPPTRQIPNHIKADVTVTFGALRPAHAVAPECGEVLVSALGESEKALGRQLMNRFSDRTLPRILATRAVNPAPINWPTTLESLDSSTHLPSLEPAVSDDKYSGGVVGICAGSQGYPGAAVLTALGAVRATSSMVRFVGSDKREVLRACPEVVVSDSVADTGRVQAWVVGPGRGTDDTAQAELAELLARPEALLIDADAITLLSRSQQLRTILRSRATSGASTLLTPHLGEFQRLAEALRSDEPTTDIPAPEEDRIGATLALSQSLGCGVLLKGRHTVIAFHLPQEAEEKHVYVIDAGHSWAATPGSGDVLAGIAGAWIAYGEAGFPNLPSASLFGVSLAVQVHAMASWLSALTPDGPAPTSASRIVESIPQATARLSG